jgi:type II secretory pathway component PulC
MINKFKDFLKTRLGKKNRDLSDQEGVPDDTNPSNNFEISDKTGETSLANSHESLKDKISGSISGLRSKMFKPNLTNWKLPDGHKKKKSFEGLTLLSPNLTKNLEHLLSRQGRETIHQVSLVLLISAVTYFFGKTTALFLKGTPQIDSSKTYSVQIDLEKDFNPSTLSQVRSINIFRTNTGLGQKKNVADTKCEKAQQTSNLPIKLINTVVLQDSVKSLASVQVRGDRSLQEVREGEQISNLAKIFKITRLQILVKNLENGICEGIESDKGRESRSPISVMSASKSREFKANKKISGIENDGNKFNISKNFLDEKIKDISSILTQAKAIKIQNPDGTMSFKLTEMDPEGLFSYLGLQDQDIITSINGRPIYDMNEVMGLFGRIKNLDKLQLGVKREGTDSVLDYNIKK